MKFETSPVQLNNQSINFETSPVLMGLSHWADRAPPTSTEESRRFSAASRRGLGGPRRSQWSSDGSSAGVLECSNIFADCRLTSRQFLLGSSSVFPRFLLGGLGGTSVMPQRMKICNEKLIVCAPRFNRDHRGSPRRHRGSAEDQPTQRRAQFV